MESLIDSGGAGDVLSWLQGLERPGFLAAWQLNGQALCYKQGVLMVRRCWS